MAGSHLDLVLLGPVGAGKGTQARRIATKYGVPHIASGDLLRAHRARDTELGREAKNYMDHGALVPDNLVITMIVDRMRLEVPYVSLVERAAGRWTCRICQSTYNYTVKPPRRKGICDLDGGELYQRDDDRFEVVSERIKVYIQDTVPVVDYYRERGILREIDGTRDIESVASAIGEQLEAAVW